MAMKFKSNYSKNVNNAHIIDMCYSVHFHKVFINTPKNAQLILLYNDKSTCFDPPGSLSGLYIQYQKLQIKMCIKYL
jgi:hypothetical protein